MAHPPQGWGDCPLLRLTAFSMGQSDCLLLECGGEAMLVDGGEEAYAPALLSALEEKGIRRLRYVLNTHFHPDHIGGLLALLEQGFEMDAYLHPYQPNAIYGNALHRRAVRLAKASNVPMRQTENGETLLLGEAQITLWRNDAGLSTNARSVMARVQFGTCTLLLPADITGDTQTWCVNTLPQLLSSDVLKAPHHGVSAMVGGYLRMVSPKAVLFTNNREKAAEGALQAQQAGIWPLFTAEGDIVCETDGEDWYIYHAGKP